MSVEIDQALLSAFIAGNFGLPIAHENAGYTPKQGEAFVEVLINQNDITPFSLAGSNETDGTMSVILWYPMDAGAISAKNKAAEIMTAFFIGRTLTYAGQRVTIKSQRRQPGAPENGWYKLSIILSYWAAVARIA